MNNKKSNIEEKEISRFTKKIKELPSRKTTIKLDIRTWNSLKNLKKENENFDDVIKKLLNERTKAVGDDNIKAIKYQRKRGYFTMVYNEEIGFEYEYNDVKNIQDDFVLDLKIKKIFFRKKVFSPSNFFGVDNVRKHYSNLFMESYFSAVELALMKELKIHILHEPTNIAYWRKLYYEYSLSEESFKSDIQEPLRLSEEEKPSEEWRKKIKSSVANKFMNELGVRLE